MKEIDLYGILQISKDATQEDIKKAYRKLALQYHPDKNKGDKLCEEKFKIINEAYSTLSDPHKKEAYDRTLRIQKKDIRFDFFFGNLFNQFFQPDFRNEEEKYNIRGVDVYENICLNKTELENGCVKNFKYLRPTICSNCDGKGKLKQSIKTQCDICSGRGKQKVNRGFIQTEHPCKKCHGAGLLEFFECNSCNCTGIKKVETIIKLKVPPNTKEGMIFKCEKSGGLGEGFGPNGDLFVTIKFIEEGYT